MHVNVEFKRYDIKCDVIKPLSLLKFDSHQISDPLCLVSLGGIAIEFIKTNPFLLQIFFEFLSSFMNDSILMTNYLISSTIYSTNLIG